jgi:hypothetical protein
MIPAHEDISALRLALWDLGEAAKDYLEKQTEETERRLRNRLAKAERARDLSHQHEREREEPRHGTPRQLDGETAPEYVTGHLGYHDVDEFYKDDEAGQE